MTDQRWLVEVAPEFREDTGQFEDVGAESVEIQDGCLVFRNKDNVIVFIRAAGTWSTCCPDES